MAVVVEKERFDVGKDGRAQLSIQWLTDTRTEAQRQIPVTYDGLTRTRASGVPFLSKDDGRYLVDAVYEGLFEDQAVDSEQFELDYESREVKIEAFPDREVLRRDWGATEEDGRLVFTPKISPPAGAGTGLGAQATPEIDNPFYNLTTYPVEYAVAKMRILRRRVPASLERSVNTVIDRIPSGFDYQGNAKSWLVRPLRRRKIGNVWEINVVYQQVDEFKDVNALLVLLQKVRTEGRGTGLTTGSLTTGSL
jgi:hypothetical protein